MKIRALGQAMTMMLLVLVACTPGPEGVAPPLTRLENTAVEILLPEPRGPKVTLQEVLQRRRSVRQYSADPLTLEELGLLLWACQGITDPRGFRTAPSAGALYPLEVYLVAGRVRELEPGVYHYVPEGHSLRLVAKGDVRDELCRAALGQKWVAGGAVVVMIACEYQRTTARYGERGIRYVHMEAGHAAQNLLLQAVALGLGAVPVGAFDDQRTKEVVGLPEEQEVLYLIPVGRIP